MKLRIVTKRTEPNHGTKAPRRGAKLMHFDAAIVVSSPDAKKWEEVKDAAGTVIDYRNVTIKGYLSTFRHVTESDRDGDYVERGAFTETIPNFMKNPVLLVNHQNSVKTLGGRFTPVKEDEKGLYVEALLSNSPSEDMRDVRFKVAEGSLRTLSMGGVFHYKEDGRGIFRVMLWEGSLTPVPANPDAVFSVRSLTDAEIKKVQSESEPGETGAE